MNKTALPDDQGFKASSQILQTFEGRPRYYRLSGPAALVRLVQFGRTLQTGEALHASSFDGACWFDERLYQISRTRALISLNSGSTSGPELPFVGLHMKFTLREDLAVSQDWNRFDAYITFSFGPKENIVALAGKTRAQPYYSAAHPWHNDTDIKLTGMGEQYIIDFQFPPNRHLLNRIRGPFLLGSNLAQAKR